MIRATCIGCGCDDDNACADSEDPAIGCHWLRVDYDEGLGVCSECRDHAKRWDAGDREPAYD